MIWHSFLAITKSHHHMLAAKTTKQLPGIQSVGDKIDNANIY